MNEDESGSKSKTTERLRAWRPLPEPPGMSRTRRGLNILGVVIAVAAAAMLVPATFRYQLSRIPPPGKREWRMYDLVAITETKAIERFGPPTAQVEYQLNKGSVAGPLLGQKHYYPLGSTDYEKHLQEAKVAWTYPAYSAVRELTWKLPDSYLTIWFQEPRAEINFSDGNADLALPATGPGEWVALDNYRVGLDLVAPTAGGKGGGTPGASAGSR